MRNVTFMVGKLFSICFRLVLNLLANVFSNVGCIWKCLQYVLGYVFGTEDWDRAWGAQLHWAKPHEITPVPFCSDSIL